jgi:hypothetical protein
MSSNDPSGIKKNYSRKAIFSKAHWNANWKRLSGDKRPYAAIFAEQLRLSWAQARRAIEAKQSAAVREELRAEQNFGLPLASCAFDLNRRSYFRTTRAIGAVGA